jgi:hypothetical protein
MKWFFIFAFTAVSAAAFAQQQVVDPAWQQQLINTLQTQRNKATDEAAVAQSQFSVAQSVIANLQKQNAELQKQIDDLKAKYEPKAEEPKVETPSAK